MVEKTRTAARLPNGSEEGAKKQRRGLTRRMRRTAVFYAYTSPWLLGVIFLTLAPLAVGIYLSLTNYDGLNWNNLKFIGLDNYIKAFSDNDVRYSFRRTLQWVALNVPLWVSLSFLVALVLHRDVRGRGIFRTIYYLPQVMPLVATVWVWKIFLDKNNGLLNAMISLFRPGTAIPWLTTNIAIYGVTLMAVWSGLGWGMVIFLAGLQDIPDELIEAARIDGANTLQVFRHVTLPLMTPIVFFVMLNGVIGSFQQFQIPLLLTSGRWAGMLGGSGENFPPRAVHFYMLNVLIETFSFSRFGYANALIWLMFVVIVVLAAVLFWSQRYWVYTEAGGRS
jgi:multiple sugar transport system permease protein